MQNEARMAAAGGRMTQQPVSRVAQPLHTCLDVLPIHYQEILQGHVSCYTPSLQRSAVVSPC